MNRIPKSEYKIFYGIPCITADMFKQYHTEKEFTEFSKWFTGQTGILGENNELGIYASDYEKWLKSRSQK